MPRKQTVEAAKKAEELHKKIYGNKNETDETSESTETTVETSETKTPTGTTETPVGSTETPVESAETTTETTEIKPPETSEQPEKEDTLEYWRQKYNSLQGKYSSEMKAMQEEISTMREKFDEYNKILANIPTEEDKEAEPDATPAINISDYVTQDEINEWGPDFLNTVIKIAANAANKVVGDKMSQLAPMQEDINTIRKEQLTDREIAFFMRLDHLVPNWREINKDQNFVNWLNQPDGLAVDEKGQRITRGQNADRALERLDAKGLAAYFNEFLKSQPSTTVQTQESTAPTATETPQIKKTATINISPPKSHADRGTHTPPSEPKVTTYGDLQKAAQQVIDGKITEEEFDKVRANFVASNEFTLPSGEIESV